MEYFRNRFSNGHAFELGMILCSVAIEANHDALIFDRLNQRISAYHRRKRSSSNRESDAQRG